MLGYWILISQLAINIMQWMPLVEFVEQPLIQEDCMFKKVIDICIARLGKHYCGLSVHQVASRFDGKTSSLYYNVVDSQDMNCIGNWNNSWSQLIPSLLIALRINVVFLCIIAFNVRVRVHGAWAWFYWELLSLLRRTQLIYNL